MTDEISTSLQHVLNRVRAQKGITYRVNRFLGIRVEDDTIFTQAATLYVLKSLSNYLLHEESAVVASIEELITPKYPEFRNKNGRFSYNFYFSHIFILIMFYFPFGDQMPLFYGHYLL